MTRDKLTGDATGSRIDLSNYGEVLLHCITVIEIIYHNFHIIGTVDFEA